MDSLIDVLNLLKRCTRAAIDRPRRKLRAVEKDLHGHVVSLAIRFCCWLRCGGGVRLAIWCRFGRGGGRRRRAHRLELLGIRDFELIADMDHVSLESVESFELRNGDVDSLGDPDQDISPLDFVDICRGGYRVRSFGW